jgi:replicative DNA helicase
MRHDDDAERIVLGALMTDPRIVDDVLASGITAEDFYEPRHEIIFAAILDASRASEPHTATEVAQRLSMDDLRRAGGATYLLELISAVPTAANGPYQARKVVSFARLRFAQQVATRLGEMAEHANADDVDAVVEAMRAEFDERTANRTRGDLVSFGDLLTAAMDRWETTDDTVLPTGWLDLDECLNGGLRPGHLCVIGARPAVGKSVAASGLAAHAASRGVGTLFVSLEMPRGEVVDRVAANVGQIDLSHITRRDLDDLDWQRAARVMQTASAWPLYVDDRSGNTVTNIRARARDLHRAKGLGLVVVDYLQIVRPHDRRSSREQQVSEIAKGLRAIGRELSVPVVALAQVNREAAKSGERPTMAQLRESGAIEADADEVILLHRDDKESPGEIEFNIEKNRHGRTGKVTLAWAPHYARIASIARWQEAAS